MASLELTEIIDAPLPLLWHYLSTAAGLSAWHADRVTGSLDEGFRVAWPSLNAELDLRVEHAETLKRLVLRAGSTTVQLSLSHGGVHLLHEGLDEDDDLAGFRSSWALALSLLKHAILAHPKKPRHVGWLFERAMGDPELVHFYFSTKLGLERWLGSTTSDLGAPGSAARLDLGGGHVLSGRVLCHEEGRDLALEWSELGGAALVLRTLPAARGQRSLSLALSTYDAEPPAEVLALLKRRLSALSEILNGRGRG